MLTNLDGALPFSQGLRKFLPPSRTGKPPHLSTGLRWHSKGVIARNGERVRLNAVRIGGVLYLRPSDVEQFLLALNADTPAAQEHADAEFARQAREESAALEKLGC